MMREEDGVDEVSFVFSLDNEFAKSSHVRYLMEKRFSDNVITSNVSFHKIFHSSIHELLDSC